MTNYPQLNISNENHLAKLTVGKVEKSYRNVSQMRSMIKHCKDEHDALWKDNPKQTDAEAGKFFRTCKTTDLGMLLKRFDRLVLSPYDSLLPCHIHGGVKGMYTNSKGQQMKKSTESAALSLVNGSGTWLIRMDLQRFYEQISKEDIFFLLHMRCGCSMKMANLVADLCTTKIGPKTNPTSDQKVLARGFSTSTRLATWCKINFFLEVRKELEILCGKGSVKTVVYIDDIGVSIKTSDPGLVIKAVQKIKKIATRHDLKINEKKTQIIPPEERKEHLGCHIGNSSISADSKSLKKEFKTKKRACQTKDPVKRKKLTKSWRLCKQRIKRIAKLSA